MKLIDAHCHLANLADVMPLNPLLQEAEKQDISRFVSSVLRKSEAVWHIQNPDERIIYSAGIHPNFEECDLDLELINQLCRDKRIWAIGEIGLDHGNRLLVWQREIFASQLELATSYKLPVVLHIVGHQSEAYTTLRKYPLSYLVHGYAGSVEGFIQLAKLDSVFTISSRIMKEDKRDLLKAMLSYKRIMFETDITQYYVQEGESNPLLRLWTVVKTCSQLSGIKVQNLLKLQAESARQLLPRELG